ncbi:MAG: 50S ribosomal protein L5 [Mycoplasmataceae bacterium]|nr:50S ribosomal protein L5 [Mycoplasmataceae bacterium]MBR3259162.1 50S ribosomal protein L5 [Mycoplasmataceae bacterium]MBR3571225.1 50S ribosomal protein L5 [Mycoplasmataceae bacterium]
MKSSLQIKYEKEIVPVLMKKFNYTSVMEVPKIEKIVINMTAGKEVSNSKAIEEVQNELMFITGQKPLTVIAKKSNASFKLREGMPMGGKVTMRRERMWTFLNELINVSIPRIRDFRGVNPKAFDGRGNYSLGIKEQIIFPEISFDKIRRIKGLDVIIVTTAKTDEESFELLKLLGMPFVKVQSTNNR